MLYSFFDRVEFDVPIECVNINIFYISIAFVTNRSFEIMMLDRKDHLDSGPRPGFYRVFRHEE